MNRVETFFTSFSKLSVHSPLLFDCGSTITRVFFEGKLIAQEPTCVAVHAKSGQTVAIGKKAVSLLGKVSDKFKVEFPLSSGEIASPSLLKKFFEVLISRFDSSVFSKVIGFPVIVVIPSELSPVQKTVYKDTFKQAGFRSVELIEQAQSLLQELGGEGKRESSFTS